MQDLVIIDSRSARVRLALVAIIILALACGVFMARWQLAGMLASLTRPTDPNSSEIAAIALGWSPSDPTAAWLMAATAEDPTLFEQTIRLAPNDYRWRAEFGRALEQDDQADRAEAQFKRAVDLAPSFAYPRWRLANFYLRQDRVDEALAELKKAAANSQTYREQAFSLVWDLFGKDPAVVESLAGDDTAGRARLAYFFASRGSADNAVRVWNSLSEAQRNENLVLARGMALGLYNQRHFPESLEFSKQADLDPDAVLESITNPSFEKGIGDAPDSMFGWKIVRSDPRFEAMADQKVKQDGNRSLRVSFRNFNKPELHNIFQTVAVMPSTRYRVKFWVRTENLKSAGTPLLEVINANDDMLLARSPSFATGSVDWQEYFIDLITPENCNGVTIRTARAYCGEGCPIVGVFWYDDFELLRQ